MSTKLVFSVLGFIYPDGSYDYGYTAVVGPSTAPRPCARHRTVRILREQANGPDILVGSDRSDRFGVAVVTRHNPALASVAGIYYAKVAAARKKIGRHRTLKCRADRSPSVQVTEPVFQAAGADSRATGPVARPETR